MEYLGMKLKALRQEKSITQKHLADFLEIAPATVSAYETGSNYPSVDIVIKLCKFFNVSADYLLGLSDKKEFNMTDLTDEQYQATAKLNCVFSATINLSVFKKPQQKLWLFCVFI